MDDFKATQLDAQLLDLRRAVPGVAGSVILSAEGLCIAADLPDPATEEPISARAAAMLALAERIAAELRRGALDGIFISGDAGHLIVAPITPDAALTVLCHHDARLPMTALDIRYSVAQLRRLLA